MSELSDIRRAIFYVAAPEDLEWVEVIDHAFEKLKQICRLTRGSLDAFPLLEDMTPQQRSATLASLKRQRRQVYGTSADFSVEEVQQEAAHYASYRKGVQIVVVLVSRHLRNAGLLADPGISQRLSMREWSGTSAVVGLLLEPVDEHIWPGQIHEIFWRTTLPTNGQPLSAWENQAQGLEQMTRDLLQVIWEMWKYKHQMEDLDSHEEEAAQAEQEMLRIDPSHKRALSGKPLFSEKQRLQRGEAIYRSIVQLDPTFTHIWILRGV